jgi:preprotein translocase subunit SecF
MMSGRGGIGGRLYRGDVSIEFVGRQRLWYMVSGAILAISVIAVIVLSLNFSVDFKGGSVFEFPAGTTTISQVRQTVSGAGGGADAIVQETHPLNGGAKWQVQTHPLTPSQQSSVETAISRTFHLQQNQISSTFVGASWGAQISQKALKALIAFLIVVVIYLSAMFEWKMAVAALIALAHDIVITIGVYALLRFQVSPASVIGLLTILGYSLYDTVVVFDKVRENTAGILGTGRVTYSQAANQALNQTLVRSINTSLIALLPVASILFVGAGFLGAGELKDLALVLFVGMLSGTYSSICIATPVLADLKEREPQYRALAKRAAQRAGGGRAAKRAAAKAGVGAGEAEPDMVGSPQAGASGRAGSSGRAASRKAGAGQGQSGLRDDAGLAGTGAADEAPVEETAGAGEPVPAGAGQPASRRVTPSGGSRPGPRQQPRRSSSAKRRPSGKKRRR